MRNSFIIFLILVFVSCSNNSKQENKKIKDDFICDSLFEETILNKQLKRYIVKEKSDTAILKLYFQDISNIKYKHDLLIKLFCFDCKGYFYYKPYFKFQFYHKNKNVPAIVSIIPDQYCTEYKNLKLNYPKIAATYWYLFDSMSNEQYRLFTVYSNNIYKNTFVDTSKMRSSTVYFSEFLRKAHLKQKVNGHSIENLLVRLYMLSLYPENRCGICGKSNHFDRIFKIMGKDSIVRNINEEDINKKLDLSKYNLESY